MFVLLDSAWIECEQSSTGSRKRRDQGRASALACRSNSAEVLRSDIEVGPYGRFAEDSLSVCYKKGLDRNNVDALLYIYGSHVLRKQRDAREDRTYTQMQLLDLSHFVDKGHQLKAAYAAAEPFPHLVIDDFLPPEVLDGILEEFPNPEEIDWITYDTSEEKTLRSKSELQISEATRLLLYQLNSSTFLNFLEELTGIEGLVPDPHFLGSGLHQTLPDGYMKIHVDFNHHKRLPLEHRLNLLIYLNKDWREEYGGHLELWNRDMSQCVRRILPIFNRCLIFTSTETSYHGHPDPLTCPKDRSRRSLATYYYTIPSSGLSSNLHRTLWKSRPGESIRSDGTRRIMKRLTPPILIDVWHAFKRFQERTPQK